MVIPNATCALESFIHSIPSFWLQFTKNVIPNVFLEAPMNIWYQKRPFFTQHNTKIHELISFMVWEQWALEIRALNKNTTYFYDTVLFKQNCIFLLLCVYLISEFNE